MNEERLQWEVAMQKQCRDGGKGTLAIDFDDTLTAPGGVDALVELRRRGYGLVVFTANADFDGIRSWLRQRWPEGDDPPPVTDRKPQAIAFIDDKAVTFIGWRSILGQFI